MADDPPVPVTSSALSREVGYLRDYVDVQFQAHHTRIAEITTEIDNRISALGELTESKFVTFRTLIDGEASKVAVALNASDKAISKAEAATAKSFDAVDVRFHSMNEFRGQLADQAKTLMPRAESLSMHAANAARAEAQFNTLEATMNELKDRMNRSEGKSTGYSASGSLIVACFTVLGILVSAGVGLILVLNN